MWFDKNEKVINSFIKIDLNSMEWKDVQLYRPAAQQVILLNNNGDNAIEEDGFCQLDMNKAYAYGHQMTVITYNRSFVKFNQLGKANYDEEPYLIKHEGIYMFGGVTGMTESEQTLSNKLFFLPIGGRKDGVSLVDDSTEDPNMVK